MDGKVKTNGIEFDRASQLANSEYLANPVFLCLSDGWYAAQVKRLVLVKSLWARCCHIVRRGVKTRYETFGRFFDSARRSLTGENGKYPNIASYRKGYDIYA